MINFKIFASKSFLLLLACFLFSVGCKKPTTFFKTDTGDKNRKSPVKFLNADDIIVHALDFTPPIEEFAVMTLSRDPNSQADINQSLSVKLVKSPAQIADYNSANGTSYIELPSSAFTFLDDLNNITFEPGEFAKGIMIRLNKAALDLTYQYALGLTIASVGPGGIISSVGDRGLAAILLKNKYDGHYSATGTMVDYVLSNLVGYYPLEWDLITTGPNSVVVVDRDFTGTPTHIILDISTTPPTLNQYGSFGLRLNFDPATNMITSITNYYGQPAANTRSAQLDPTGANWWNPANKNIDIKYFMLQPSFVPAPPYIRTAFAEHWEYVGPR